jgi:hypothetical protein
MTQVVKNRFRDVRCQVGKLPERVCNNWYYVLALHPVRLLKKITVLPRLFLWLN